MISYALTGAVIAATLGALPLVIKAARAALEGVDQVSIVLCPAAAADPAVHQAVISQIQAHCTKMLYRVGVIESPPGAAIADVEQFAGQFSDTRLAFYYPWINVVNPQTDDTILMPPAGHIAGIYARSDDARGVQKDPANEVIRGIDSLQFKLTDAQQAFLNPVGINALRYFKDAGNLVWGGRTTSLDPSWKYINVRRVFIFVEQSILRATRWAVFEVNDEPLWATIRRSVGDFLTRMWMDGMLQGATKDQAYFVRCDRTTMTQADIRTAAPSFRATSARRLVDDGCRSPASRPESSFSCMCPLLHFSSGPARARRRPPGRSAPSEGRRP